VEEYHSALAAVKEQGGEILFGGGQPNSFCTSKYYSEEQLKKGNFVVPAITRVSPDSAIVQKETFVPILHTFPYENLDDAIKWNNQVAQGLSSTLFTNDVGNVFKWTG
jgi:aldehyde dehydrogenase family 7 member A1